VRVFLGIAIDGPVVTTIAHACETIRGASPAWRGEKWVPPENLHITVRFLGEVSGDAIPALNALLADVTAHHRTHDIVLAGITTRPRPRSATMLWATFAGDIETTGTMVEDLSDALTTAGYGHPEHPFSPHATLVRARRPRAISADALDAARRTVDASSLEERTVSVAKVTLFSSALTPRGPLYDVLGVASLARD